MTQSAEALLFQAALGIQEPWMIKEIRLNEANHELHITLDFVKGSTFSCPECAQACKAYDTKERTWRHLNFFQFKTYLHARLPRIQCSEHGVKSITAPWARTGSGFTLLFEALTLLLVKETTVKGATRILGVNDTRLWRLMKYYVNQAQEDMDCSQVKKIAMDETSSRRGHDYVSLFLDLASRKVLFAIPGKDAATVASFDDFLRKHKGNPFCIEEIVMDMSPAFIKGAKTHFPGAHLTFDKFHLQKLVNEGVDQVRKAESKHREDLKGSRYLWLKRKQDLKTNETAQLESLMQDPFCETAQAYQMKLVFEELWKVPPAFAEVHLFEWVSWVKRSTLEPMKKVAATIERHWNGIIRWFESQINNGILEGINSLIQAAKRKARGYRTTENLIAMIYLIVGKIDLQPILGKLPT